MKILWAVVFVCALHLTLETVVSKAFPESEAWGYITLNEDYQSNMFWWFYPAQTSQPQNAPLVLWLQGGPGGSSLFGDFLEFGPLDVNLQPRNTTWLNYANLLFVDNPIGTGISYTMNPKGFCTTDQEIADMLVTFMEGFVELYPAFETIPFWIFSESYGGKMTANFGVALDAAIANGDIAMQFKGVALGDSWIAPVDCMYSYPPFLFGISLIDQAQSNNLTSYANLAEVAWKNGQGFNSTNYWSIQQTAAEEMTDNVNFYNFLKYTDYLPENQFTKLMNGAIREKLGIIPANVSFGGQSGDVFQYMGGDFMRSAVSSVDTLLAKGYQVAVYSGQLDIIVDVICIDSWINELQWEGVTAWLSAPRQVQLVDGIPNGYTKQYQNFALWGVYNAGHMVPTDNPEMALKMFKAIISS